MLSMAPVGSAGGAAKYYAADNYYTMEESAEESIWFGEGAELLGLAPGDDANIDNEAEVDQGETGQDGTDQDGPTARSQDEEDPVAQDTKPRADLEGDTFVGDDETHDRQSIDDGSPEALDGTYEPRGDEDASPEIENGGEVGSATDSGAGSRLTQEDVGTRGEDSALDSASVIHGDTDAGFDGAHLVAFDPEGIAGARDIFGVDMPVPFDPDRPGGLPEGARAPAPNTRDAGRFPLSNPDGKVDALTFENILNGKLPDGTQIGEPGKRALGMDLTFSMPKSASVLALVGGDKRINQAHMGAVKTAMRWVEANLAEGRKKIDGRDVPIKTGNLVYALFQHDTSRALDPQGHIHAVIANMTRLPDGSWRALHNGEIWRNNTVISSVYHAAFRGALEKLGYAVQLQGKHGAFEISGVPRNVRDAFSQRREAIMGIASKLGIATPQGMDEVTARSRGAKIENTDREELLQQWKERAAALGFSPERLVEDARARTQGEPGILQRGIGVMERALRDAGGLITHALQKPKDPLIDSGLKRLALTGPEARTQLATASAIRILSKREAAFEVHQLTKAALDLGLADVTPDRITARVTQLAERKELVRGDIKRADAATMLTTREALATETGILAEIKRGQGRVEPLVRPERAIEVLSGAAVDRPLNDGQMAAASSIVSSPDRIIAVQGLAGAGKSTMLAAVANVLDFEKKPALGLAFQNKMVVDLAEGTGLATMTVARFLMDHEALLTNGDKAQANSSRQMLAGTYLILDEASMVSNDQMHALTSLANKAGVDKLVLVGDRQQLLSIDAGKSFALTQAGGISTARMDENLRQRTPELRAIAALTNKGSAGEAVRMLGDRVVETDDRIADAAAQWLHLGEKERDATMLFTSGRESRAGLNAAIQSGLKSEGKLKGEGLSLTVNERVDRTGEELRYAHSYEPGLRLEVWSKLQSVGLDRGEYRVTRLFRNGKVELERGGKRLSFDPQKLASGTKLDKLNLVATKDITLHEGDNIRWTANDKPRDLLNSAMGRVVGIEAGAITIERPDKTVVRLGVNDPMLKRMDLAYALNMHMAQGITTDKAIVVMGSEERFLSNQRLFNVAVTRVRKDVSIITNDKEKLAHQLDRTSGDKYSSLEETGRLDVDRRQFTARDPARPFDPGPLDGLGLSGDEPASAPARSPASRSADQKRAQQLPLPEKSKGLEL